MRLLKYVAFIVKTGAISKILFRVFREVLGHLGLEQYSDGFLSSRVRN